MGRSTRSATAAAKAGGGPPTQLLLIELKHRILGALHKLADRDTQQIAVDDLERIVLTLSPEGISLCLNCLYDTDAQQKSVVRKECVRLFGTLATAHGELLVPHLPKIVTTIVRRLKDTDSNVREACVETMGVLAEEVPGAGGGGVGGGDSGGGSSGPGAGGPLHVFVKPLFDAMSEQNRSLQMGAGLCLARVIECLNDPHPSILQKLCPRIVKFFGSPTFQAKAALLAVVGSLFQAAGKGAAQFLPTLVPLAQEALESTDWTTRKAAADTLSRLASTLGPALITFKKDSVEALESCRFDKVKPVRDSVGDALQQWKAIAGGDGENHFSVNSSKEAGSGTLNNLASSLTPLNSRSGEMGVSNTPRSAPGAGTGGGGGGVHGGRFAFSAGGGVHSRHSSNSPPGAGGGTGGSAVSNVKRKAPLLSDKKINPDFFRKLEIKGPDDWPVEVVEVSPEADGPPVPEPHLGFSEEAEEVKVDIVRTKSFRRSSLGGSVNGGSIKGLGYAAEVRERENGGGHMRASSGRSAAAARGGGGVETRESLVWRRGDFTTGGGTHQQRAAAATNAKPGIGSYDGKSLGSNVSVINNPISELLESNPWMEAKERDVDSWESSGREALSPSSSATYEDDGPALSSMDEWTSVQKQLQQLEFQQRSHLKMFQEFMADVHQSMLEMDVRVRGLERVINAARDVPASVNRIINGGGPSAFDTPPVRSLSKFLASSQSLSEKLRKAANASRAAFSERQPPGGVGFERLGGADVMRSGRSSSPWKHESDNGYDSPYSPSQRSGSASSNLGGGNHHMYASHRVDITSPVVSSLRGSPRDEHDGGGGEKVAVRHGWDKPVVGTTATHPFGESHVVRSVWQASKDEATLEAIRGAPVAKDDSSRATIGTTGGGAKKSSSTTSVVRLSAENILEGKETFWMLWSRAMDYIKAGDVDAAYVDVMGSGDELLLIRLMSHTGPVLNKLASGTALEMLHTAIQLLQQQSFLDSVLPWIHQVADLIATKGVDFLGLSSDGKKELVTCLQDSAAMEFPEGWMADSVADVAQQLCSVWSIEL